MNWKELNSNQDFQTILEQSKVPSNKGIVIFKHSTRCPVSAMAKMRMELDWDFPDNVPTYLVKVVEQRELSNEIERITGVTHQSPQLIYINDGKVVYSVSQGAIQVKELKKKLVE